MTPTLSSFWRNEWLWLALALLLVWLRGLFLDVMEVDAAQYASISMEMQQNGSWLQVLHREADYLDKPPLLFWLSGLSFWLFGLSNWAYKLPSFLAILLSVYAVYRFCLLYYSAQTARHAAFTFASCIGFLILCNDVRTDTLLLAFTFCAIWQLAEYLELRRKINFVIGFFFIGFSMLTKGPIGLIVPAFAVGSHLMLTRNWANVFHVRWLLGLCITALVLAPMCWGLYQQFDLHPEKIINGRSGVSGLYFYFWEQSFGRITGENVWRNNTSALYFTHVYAWAFLPWSPLLIGALLMHGQHFKAYFKAKIETPKLPEAYSFGGFWLAFVALSMSKYKLPHYIFITLPFAAIMTAYFLSHLRQKFWAYVQMFVFAVLGIALFALLGWVFLSKNALIWGISLGLLFLLWRRSGHLLKKMDADDMAKCGVLAAMLSSFVLNFHFYPHLLSFQGTAQLMKKAADLGLPAERIAYFGRHGHAADFYNGDLLENLPNDTAILAAAQNPNGLWVFTDANGKKDLDGCNVPYRLAAKAKHFQVALLKPAFLNPNTRDSTLEDMFLLQIMQNNTIGLLNGHE